MSAPIPLRRDFGASHLRGRRGRRKTAPRPVGFWLLQRSMTARRAPRRRRSAGSVFEIIRDWVLHFNERGPDGLLNGKSPGQPVQAQRRPAPSHRRHDREWADSGSPRRGALAADRSGTMDLRGVPHRDRQADAQPGAARHGLSQALRTAAPLRASRGRDRGF